MMIAICGGRTYRFDQYDIVWLDEFAFRCGVKGVLHGGANGADTCAHVWALCRGMSVTVFEADWTTYGKHAGPMRNQRIAKRLRQEQEKGVDVALVTFPGTHGTRDMVRRAKALDILVLRPTFDRESLQAVEDNNAK